MAHSLTQAAGSAASTQPVDTVLAGVQAQFEGAYVHVPFCFHKCHYCDFYSFVDHDNRQPAFVQRLLQELAAAAPLMRTPLETVFVGGGTPTLLQPALLRQALQGVAHTLPLAAGAEWTVEANPETVTDEVARVLVECGVNRVSMGAQSFHPHLLKALERWHQPESVARAVHAVRQAGIERVNIDLIFGVPGGTPQQWQDDLEHAVALAPEHISCYGLTYEPNTAMTARLQRGEFARCPEDAEAEMYQRAQETLRLAGYQQYEISNWTRAGQECRHNLLYWRNRDWMAFGPSASGHAQGTRWKNVPRLGDWLAHGPWSPAVDVERVDADGQVGERLMMGLRLREGIAAPEVERLLTLGSRGPQRARAIDAAIARGQLERVELQPRVPVLRFTEPGLLLADSVLAELV